MSDPIADFLIRIKNAHLARHSKVSAPFSNMKKALADILVTEGYLAESEIVSEGVKSTLIVTLKYVGKMPVIHTVKRVSKPGRRVYVSAQEIPKALGGYGITIVSTSKGVMTGKKAKKENIGGEVLCQIW